MALFEADEAANWIARKSTVRPISFGSTFDDAMEGLLRVSVVATGIEAESVASPRPLLSGLDPEAKADQDRAPAAEEAAPAVRPAAQVETPPAVEELAAVELFDESPSWKRSCWKKPVHRRRRTPLQP